MRTLVLCVGNVMRSDDGFGLAVCDELRARGIEVIASGPDISEILDRLQGLDRLVLVDAVDFGGEPGSLIVRSMEELDTMEIRTSTHSLSPIQFLRLVRELTGYPREVLIVGVQPKKLEIGEGLSEEVRGSLESAVNAVLSALAPEGALR